MHAPCTAMRHRKTVFKGCARKRNSLCYALVVISDVWQDEWDRLARLFGFLVLVRCASEGPVEEANKPTDGLMQALIKSVGDIEVQCNKRS